MAAHRLRQDHIHRVRHHRFAQRRSPLPLPIDVSRRERRFNLQRRPNGH